MIKKNCILLSIIACLIFTWELLVLAAVPNSISFQGQLLDSDGEPAASPQNIVFKVYTTAIGGSATATIIKNSVSIDKNGLYNVELDVSGINWAQDLYLGLTVGSDSEMTPRIKILPAASAIFSATAGSISWSNIENIPADFADGVDNVSTITVNADTIGSYHIIDSTITTSDILDGTILAADISAGVIGPVQITADADYDILVSSAKYVSGGMDADTLDTLDSTAFQLALGTSAWTAFNSNNLDGRNYTAFVSTAGGSISGNIMMGWQAIQEVNLLDVNTVQISADTNKKIETHAEGINISTSIYIVGYASATYFYGDGSNLTGLPSADNLGDHIATQDLQMGTNTLTTTAARLTISSHTYIVGYASATAFYGDGQYLTGLPSADNLGNHVATQDLQMGTNTLTTTAARLTISSHTYIVGYASATFFYGDGSNLTSIDAETLDTLDSVDFVQRDGSVAMTGNLDMGNNDINNLYQVTLSTIGTGASKVTISSHTSILGDLEMNWQAINEVNMLDVNTIQFAANPDKQIITNAAGIGISTTTVVSGDIQAEQMVFTVYVDTTTVVPSAAGILVATSDWTLYISTGTGSGAWVKVGGQ